MSAKQKILITGATSYIGRRMARLLSARGHEVVALARPESDAQALLSLGVEVASWTDFPKADALLHLATMYVGQTGAGQARSLFQSNVGHPIELADKFLSSGGRRLICAGTCWEDCGEAGLPANMYAATKASFRSLACSLASEAGAELFWLRFSDVVGDDDPRHRLFWSLRESLRARRPLSMTWGAQPFDPVWIEDAEKAILGAFDAEGGVGYCGDFSVAGGEPGALRAKIERAFEWVGSDNVPLWGEKEYRRGEPFMVNWRSPPPWWRPAQSYEALAKRMLT